MWLLDWFKPRLSWSEAKPLVVSTLGQALTELGFRNPGKMMWRFRPIFIDVVHFLPNNVGGFNIRLGCTFRDGTDPHPEPEKCEFSTILQNQKLAFQRSQQKQLECLQRATPDVVQSIRTWFELFANPATALHALENNKIFTMFEGPGLSSPQYSDLRQKLRRYSATGMIY